MNKRLIVLGPYDRYNYGDLLFPYIIEAELGKNYSSISYYSLVTSDLSLFGGKKTLPVKYLYDNNFEEKCDLIIAGGESLYCTWETLYGYISPWFSGSNISWRIIRKLLGQRHYVKTRDKIAKMVLSGRTILPFCVYKNDFTNIEKVFYNSVGCSYNQGLNSKKKIDIQKKIMNVDYFSVRDNQSKINNLKLNIDSYLTPDSAILMSKHFPIDQLKNMTSSCVLNYVEEHTKYIFFQVNKDLGQKYLDIIIKQLEELSNKTSLRICLCPIGLAQGHLDQIALLKISNKILAQHQLFKNVTIWDIMYLIAKSSLYVGTSLHGTITAMSYKIPYIGLYVPKLNNYLQTWAVEELNHTVNFNEISKTGLLALNIERIKFEKNLEIQLHKAEESFKKMV